MHDIRRFRDRKYLGRKQKKTRNNKRTIQSSHRSWRRRERKKISIKDSPIGDMYLPVELIKENLFIRRLAKYGFKGYIIRFIKEVEYSEEALNQLWIEFIKYRIIYRF